MSDKIQIRGDTSNNLTNDNPVLSDREFCVEKLANGLMKYKIGNGMTDWNHLPYPNSIGSITGSGGALVTNDGSGNYVINVTANGSGNMLQENYADGEITGSYNKTPVNRSFHADNAPISIKQFGAKLDGVTDDSIAFQQFCEYVGQNKAVGYIPEGTLYSKTYRPVWRYNDGVQGHFSIYGAGAGATTIKFGDISPIFNSSGVITTEEPDLFSIIGNSNVEYIEDIILSDFSIDYSEQVYRGGADKSTPALTDIKPISNGVDVINCKYCYRVNIKNIYAEEIYGNGFRFFYCTDCHFENVTGHNVSGGNPGLADSDGGFACFQMCLLCTGKKSSIFNERVYQTHSTGNLITSDAYGTPCGYIGFWAEYPPDTNNGKLPPLADTYFGLSLDKTQNNFSESIGCKFEDCTAYGFYIGFKAETQVNSLFVNCTSLYCFLPFVNTTARSIFIDCYANMLGLSSMSIPMSGFEFVRANFIDYNPFFNQSTSHLSSPSSGAIFDGCTSVSNGQSIFCTTNDYSRFINQRSTVISSSVDIFRFPSYYNRFVEITGYIDYKSTNNINNYIANLKLSKINLSIKSKNAYLSFTVHDLYNCEICIKGDGDVIIIQDINCVYNKISIESILNDFVINIPIFKVNSNILSRGNKYKLSFSNFRTDKSAYAIFIGSCTYDEYDINIDLVDATSPSLAQIIRGESSVVNLIINNITVSGSKINIPVFNLSTTKGIEIKKANISSTGYLITSYYDSIYGPVILKNIQSFLLFHKASGHDDPNSAAEIPTALFLNQGLKFPYVFPVSGGKEGSIVLSGGYNAKIAWATNVSVSVGAILKSGTNAYQYTTSGITGASTPTDTSGNDISDGSATCHYIGLVAILSEYGVVI